MQNKKHSIGLILFSLFIFIYGAIAFFFLLMTLGVNLSPPGRFWQIIRYLIELGWLSTGVASMVSGVGVLLQKAWGRKLWLFGACPLLVVMFALLTWINPGDVLLFGIPLLVPVFFSAYFFNRAGIKERFSGLSSR